MRGIERHADRVLEANEQDVQKGIDSGLSKALLDRLQLTDARLKDMVKGLETLIELPDPVGEVLSCGSGMTG